MRRALIAVVTVVLALSATGCRFSKVKSDATVTVSGRALNPTGAPLANTTVRLFKQADLGEAIVGIVLTVGTLGSVCLLPDSLPVCRQAKVATTDAQGNYRFVLKGSDTQGTIGTEATLNVVVADPKNGANGPSTTLSFTARSETVALPDARLWNATPRATSNRARIGMSWSALPAAAGGSPSYSAQLFDAARQAPMWTQSASARGGEIDARVLEDVRGVAAAAAQTKPGGASGAGTVRASFLSSRVTVAPTAGAPPSRHRACSAVAGTALKAVQQASCGATDGNLTTPSSLRSNTADVVTGVVIDLGRSRPVFFVVARGVAGMVIAEVSRDGRTYTTVGTGSGSTDAFAVPGSQTARYVRVRAPGGLDESLLSEVSVW
ncbi:MAG TPA: hypothetical protein VJ831_07275 [Jatrophihabitantaceae bacterium]|nr:hypothetical protein [Jatrophihabitantaceae bacterium]